MLFDDGMEVEDLEFLDASKDHVTLNDLMDALETKYELLREKLLLEMARLSSGLFLRDFEVYSILICWDNFMPCQKWLELIIVLHMFVIPSYCHSIIVIFLEFLSLCMEIESWYLLFLYFMLRCRSRYSFMPCLVKKILELFWWWLKIGG